MSMTRPLKILIADDHVIFAMGMEALLKEHCNATVARAVNGSEVLQLLKKEPYDIVFMDVLMPVIDGAETTRQLKKEFPAVKVLALTTLDDNATLTRMLKAGADGYLPKVCHFMEAQTAIAYVQEGKKYISPHMATELLPPVADVKDTTEAAPHFTPREKEIIQLIKEGYNSEQIAAKLFIDKRTVDKHRSNIFEKAQVKNAAGLVAKAIANGW